MGFTCVDVQSGSWFSGDLFLQPLVSGVYPVTSDNSAAKEVDVDVDEDGDGDKDEDVDVDRRAWRTG